MHSRNDPGEGPGAGPPASGVEPSPTAEPEPERQSGATAVPLGTPASEEEWRELKRRADEPDPDAEEDPPPSR
jgi:hypothetical protein